MFTNEFKEVLKKEGVVTIVTVVDNEPHIINSFNTYLFATEDDRILVPAYGMHKTEENLGINPNVKMTLGAKAVYGKEEWPGYVLKGIGKIIDSGSDYDMMFEKYSFLTRVFELKVTSLEQVD